MKISTHDWVDIQTRTEMYRDNGGIRLATFLGSMQPYVVNTEMYDNRAPFVDRVVFLTAFAKLMIPVTRRGK